MRRRIRNRARHKCLGSVCLFAAGFAPGEPAFTETFRVEESELGSTGANPHSILEPGYVLMLEVSRNYFAISSRKNCVYYFGEQVDIFEDGQVVSHGGAWLSGEKGARFGLMMAGTPLLGSRYYQEIAPQVAMDRAEIVGLDEPFETPAGRFEHCLRTEETTPLEKGREHKIYAPGIGLLKDGSLKLTQHGHARR